MPEGADAEAAVAGDEAGPLPHTGPFQNVIGYEIIRLTEAGRRLGWRWAPTS
jgi:hypothetical protein